MNRLKTSISHRLRELLDSLTTRVASLQQQISSGYDAQLAAAVTAARAKVPAHRAVSDEDLRRQERHHVRRTWIETTRREYGEAKVAIDHVRELLDQNRRASRTLQLPGPPDGASTQDRILFQLELSNVRAEFPRETPLAQLWAAFEAADAAGDAVRAGYLENLIEHVLDAPPAVAKTPVDAARTKRERDQVRAQLEARRDQRPTENDRSNLTAWEREIAAIDAALSAVNQALLVHGRNVA